MYALFLCAVVVFLCALVVFALGRFKIHREKHQRQCETSALAEMCAHFKRMCQHNEELRKKLFYVRRAIEEVKVIPYWNAKRAYEYNMAACEMVRRAGGSSNCSKKIIDMCSEAIDSRPKLREAYENVEYLFVEYTSTQMSLQAEYYAKRDLHKRIRGEHFAQKQCFIGDTCCICLEVYTAKKPPHMFRCRHGVHKRCYEENKVRILSCPMCRSEL